MKTEEKQLLLKDLSARLPYQVVVSYKNSDTGEAYNQILDSTMYNLVQYIPSVGGLVIKPYLRPMSSMTEEEKEEIEVFVFNKWYQEDSCKIDKEGWIEILANYDVSGIDPCFCSDYVDWLLEHHFDFRNLIEKGLAIDCTNLDIY